MLPKSLLNVASILKRTSFGGPPARLLVMALSCNLTVFGGQDVRPLTTGQTIERELTGGESHSYKINLGTGEYVSLLIEPHGIELNLKLLAPDGQQLAHVVSVVEAVRGKHLSLIADRSGDYQLIVSSSFPSSKRGAYKLSEAARRLHERADVKRVAAERLVEEGERLEGLRKAEASRTAITKYEQANTLWREVGEQLGQANAYEKSAETWRLLNEYSKAIEAFGAALQLRRDAGDKTGEAVTLTNIGATLNDMNEYQKALDHFNQALALNTGSRHLEANLLNNMGASYRRSGDYRKAQGYYMRALEMIRATGDRRTEAIVANNLGLASQFVGEYQQALDSYGLALSLWRAIGDGEGEGATLNNLGLIYTHLGDEQRAVEIYGQAIRLRRAAGNRFGEALGLNNLGNIQLRIGNRDKALEYFNQALTLYRSIKDRAGESNTLNSIGRVHQVEAAHQQALDYFSQSLQISRAVGNRFAEIIALRNIARSRYSTGDYSEARNGFREALRLLGEAGDRSNEASTRLALARAERSLGNLSAAVTEIESAIDLIELLRTRVASTDLRVTYQAANHEFYQLHIDLLMQLERDHPGEGYAAKALQVSERARSRSLLDLLTETQADLRQGADPSLIDRERLLIAQINANDTRRRQLLSRKRDEARIAANDKELGALLSGYREVQAELRARSPRYAALTQPQTLSVKQIQESLLDDNTMLLEFKLGPERSYLWAVTRDTFRHFDLPAAAEIEKSARQVYGSLLAVRGQVPVGETSRERSERLARVKSDYHLSASRLSNMLLGPLDEMLGKKRLVIVSDGALQYIPFSALPAPKKLASGVSVSKEPRNVSNARGNRPSSRQGSRFGIPLIVDHEIVSLPSASVLSVLRHEQQGRTQAPQSIAVVADPVFTVNDERLSAHSRPKGEQTDAARAEYDALTRSSRDAGISGFRRLKFSRDEALAIAGLVPASRVLTALDFKASRATALSPEMSRYRVVHFATHGLLNAEHPELSGLVLSLVDEQGQLQDGFLRLHEVYGLKMSADLVVLSGCETALGKEIRGEGLIGLTRGFMYAGSPRVIASLWNVSDRATARLMKDFYQRMLGQGLRPAAALREAQVAIWKEKPEDVPHLWAAFVLQGEWR